MKRFLQIIIFCLLIFTLLLNACINSINRDASRLAALHRQRVNMVHLMLQARDTALINEYYNELQLLETEFNQLQVKYDHKYADSNQHAAFEKAFNKALKSSK